MDSLLAATSLAERQGLDVSVSCDNAESAEHNNDVPNVEDEGTEISAVPEDL